MADDVPTILGQERAALEADLPMLRTALKAVQQERAELATEDRELENLEALITSTKKAIDDLQREAFALLGNWSRTDDDVQDFTKRFFLLKKEVQLISSINNTLIDLFKKHAETEMRAKPLFHALAAHASNLSRDIITVQNALYGTQDWYAPEDRHVPEYVKKFLTLHPSKR